MIERDYILRLFTLLGRALARILFFRETKKYDEALVEIDSTALTLLGLKVEMIERMSVAGLKDVLGSDPALLQSKLYTAGVLLKEKAEILRLQEHEDESARMYLKSLYLFLEEIPKLEDIRDEREIETIDLVIENLKDYELPVELRRRMARYFENLGRYDKSEDTLFEIAEQDSDFVRDGISFYERLLLKSDAELESGRLPRDEVEEGLAKLREKMAGKEKTREDFEKSAGS